MKWLPALLLLLVSPGAWAGNSVFIEELTWPELQARQQAGARRVIIPTGGTEQNGPHIALGKHNRIVRDSAERIAIALGDTLVAPVMAYVPEGRITPPQGHMRFPGTISLSESHFAALLEDAARSLKQGGFTRIYFLGDSGGNQQAQQKVADRLNRRWHNSPVRVYHVSAYYIRGDAHGGRADTSQILAVHPASVRPAHIARYHAADYPALGVAGDPAGASAREGRRLLDRRIRAAVKQMRRYEAAGT